MNASDTVAEIAAAMVLVQADLTNPAKTRRVVAGQKRYSFAPLPDILEDVRPILNSNGISILQETVTLDNGVGVTTRLLHVSGEWVEFGPLLFPRPNDAQAIGSSLTYARRYAVTAALGIAPDEDDDGAGATRTPPAGRAVQSEGSTAQANARAKGGQVAQAAPSDAAGELTPHAASEGVGSDTDSQIAYGEGAAAAGTDPAPSSHFLSKDDQALLKAEYGGQVEAIKAYKARFGSHITRLADITYEMRDQMAVNA